MTKIAIIEDDVVISHMYRMKFESEGFEVQLASSGERGIALVETFRPDMILLDLTMPGVDGTETLKNIRSEDWGKNIPVIILTNTGEEEAPSELKDMGVTGYIVKANNTPKQVVQQVREALEG